jgi:hypothetical protein
MVVMKGLEAFTVFQELAEVVAVGVMELHGVSIYN